MLHCWCNHCALSARLPSLLSLIVLVSGEQRYSSRLFSELLDALVKDGLEFVCKIQSGSIIGTIGELLG